MSPPAAWRSCCAGSAATLRGRGRSWRWPPTPTAWCGHGWSRWRRSRSAASASGPGRRSPPLRSICASTSAPMLGSNCALRNGSGVGRGVRGDRAGADRAGAARSTGTRILLGGRVVGSGWDGASSTPRRTGGRASPSTGGGGRRRASRAPTRASRSRAGGCSAARRPRSSRGSRTGCCGWRRRSPGGHRGRGGRLARPRPVGAVDGRARGGGGGVAGGAAGAGAWGAPRGGPLAAVPGGVAGACACGGGGGCGGAGSRRSPDSSGGSREPANGGWVGLGFGVPRRSSGTPLGPIAATTRPACQAGHFHPLYRCQTVPTCSPGGSPSLPYPAAVDVFSARRTATVSGSAPTSRSNGPITVHSAFSRARAIASTGSTRASLTSVARPSQPARSSARTARGPCLARPSRGSPPGR